VAVGRSLLYSHPRTDRLTVTAPSPSPARPADRSADQAAVATARETEIAQAKSMMGGGMGGMGGAMAGAALGGAALGGAAGYAASHHAGGQAAQGGGLAEQSAMMAGGGGAAAGSVAAGGNYNEASTLLYGADPNALSFPYVRSSRGAAARGGWEDGLGSCGEKARRSAQTQRAAGLPQLPSLPPYRASQVLHATIESITDVAQGWNPTVGSSMGLAARPQRHFLRFIAGPVEARTAPLPVSSAGMGGGGALGVPIRASIPIADPSSLVYLEMLSADNLPGLQQQQQQGMTTNTSGMGAGGVSAGGIGAADAPFLGRDVAQYTTLGRWCVQRNAS
jgi:hypothetical protein